MRLPFRLRRSFCWLIGHSKRSEFNRMYRHPAELFYCPRCGAWWK